MSDFAENDPRRPHRDDASELPTWMLDALRTPAVSTTSARERILDAVRVEAKRAPNVIARHLTPSAAKRWESRWQTRWQRRTLSPVGSVLTSLVLALFVMLRIGNHSSPADAIAFSRVLGDSIVPASTIGTDDGVATHWLDTLRVVELVLRAPAVHQAVVVGAFNQWRQGTPLSRVGRDEWRARVLVPRDALRLSSSVAVLVDNVRTVPVISR